MCRYVEANVVKSKCDILERKELEKYNKDRNDKIRIKSEQLAQKHILEKNGLKQKVDSEYDEMSSMKTQDYSKLMLKYKNRKLDLEIQQKGERNARENNKSSI